MFGKILSFFGGEMLHRVSHNAKSFILLVPFLTLSCTSEDVVSDDSSVAVYSTLSGEEQKIWDYFIKYN
ncbi:MAG TPA: hypothetical protein DCE74_12710, partial [Porphyromonadaceae bacterium]|nr:hypothetical protein [Porphyromonadaceae bacterium]